MDFTLRGKSFSLTDEKVIEAMHDVPAEKINRYVVKIGDRIYPPKQVLARVTGLPAIAFTTQDAYRVLERLGFSVVSNGGDTYALLSDPQRMDGAYRVTAQLGPSEHPATGRLCNLTVPDTLFESIDEEPTRRGMNHFIQSVAWETLLAHDILYYSVSSDVQASLQDMAKFALEAYIGMDFGKYNRLVSEPQGVGLDFTSLEELERAIGSYTQPAAGVYRQSGEVFSVGIPILEGLGYSPAKSLRGTVPFSPEAEQFFASKNWTRVPGFRISK